MATLDDAETVDALVALGVDEAEARRALEEDRVPLVLVRQLLGEEPRYDLAEVAAEAGIDVDVIRSIFAALGIPLQDRFGESDVEEAREIADLLEVFSGEALVRLARVRGMAVNRIAMGDVSAVRDELIAPLRRTGADDLTVAVALAETAKALLPLSSELLVHAHRRALLHVLSSEIAKIGAQEGGQELDLTVGFVDLVGYTALSARVDPQGLDEVLEAFERRVFGVAGAAEDVDLVKFLGDAAMLVAPDPVLVADVLLDLASPGGDLDDSPLRAGMARGGTLVREGDYFGPAVNMAARLTDQARPWTVLADDALRDVLDGRFHLSRIRPVRLRGLGVRRPVSVSRADRG